MSDSVMTPLLDAGYLPHSLIRICIRRQLAERARSLATTTLAEAYESKMRYVERLKTGPIGTETRTAKRQRNELGSGVWKDMLGPRMKQSCSLYEKGGETLAQAEVAMLRLYVERAELEDGQAILDLG
jgi:cyclopropane fatty-acyl-phospholipid synthase-like methyltransferase